MRVFPTLWMGILFFCFLPFSAYCQWQPSKKALAKAESTLEHYFEVEYSKSAIDISSNYYQLISSDSILGYACIQQAPSKHDMFDFMAIYSSDMELLKLRVLTYRENYGGEIANKRWLKQFLSREVNDVQAISGATISVESMKMAVYSLTQKMRNWQSSQL
ncbi:MAG: FMN-binding protein [Flavobacteriales bacterium]|nr:FMN-binding protein [Flavobacteriales bacterium]